MKILALDSSGLVASAALTQDDVLVAEYTTNYKKTHSQTLLPMLDELKRMVGLDLHTVDVIAVAAGPGSFTGLRIGAATAKGLGLALRVPIAPVPTFGKGKGGECRQEALLEQCAISVEMLAERLNEFGREVIFLGDGVPVYREMLQERLKIPFSFAPACCNRQRAALVACLGAVYAREGRLVDADRFAPEYLRMSQAERERMEADEIQKEAMKAGKAPSHREE